MYDPIRARIQSEAALTAEVKRLREALRDMPNTSREYGVRREGGHIEAKLSMHMAVREVESRIAAGEKNVWLVQRQVEDWQAPSDAS